LFGLAQSSEQLGELKIAGDVIRMICQQLAEVRLSRVGLTIGRTAHRQAISQKRVVWFGDEKLFQLNAS
jgi:hypothetical protein